MEDKWKKIVKIGKKIVIWWGDREKGWIKCSFWGKKWYKLKK